MKGHLELSLLAAITLLLAVAAPAPAGASARGYNSAMPVQNQSLESAWQYSILSAKRAHDIQRRADSLRAEVERWTQQHDSMMRRLLRRGANTNALRPRLQSRTSGNISTLIAVSYLARPDSGMMTNSALQQAEAACLDYMTDSDNRGLPAFADSSRTLLADVLAKWRQQPDTAPAEERLNHPVGSYYMALHYIYRAQDSLGQAQALMMEAFERDRQPGRMPGGPMLLNATYLTPIVDVSLLMGDTATATRYAKEKAGFYMRRSNRTRLSETQWRDVRKIAAALEIGGETQAAADLLEAMTPLAPEGAAGSRLPRTAILDASETRDTHLND